MQFKTAKYLSPLLRKLSCFFLFLFFFISLAYSAPTTPSSDTTPSKPAATLNTDSQEKKKPKQLKISGQVFVGNAKSVKVNVRSLKSTGFISDVIANAVSTTDEKGNYFISLPDGISFPIVVEADFKKSDNKSSATYDDIMTSIGLKSPHFSLRAIVSEVPKDGKVNITPLTEIAARKTIAFASELKTQPNLPERNNNLVASLFAGVNKEALEKAKKEEEEIRKKQEAEKKANAEKKEKQDPEKLKAQEIKEEAERVKRALDLRCENSRIDIISETPLNSEKAGNESKEYSALIGAVSQYALNKSSSSSYYGKSIGYALELLGSGIMTGNAIEDEAKKDFAYALAGFLNSEKNQTGIKKTATELFSAIENNGDILQKKSSPETLESGKVELTKDLQVEGGKKAKLTAKVSKGFTPKSIEWIQLENSYDPSYKISLQCDGSQTCEFTAPQFPSDTPLWFKLIAVGQKGETAYDTAKVIVKKSPFETPSAPSIKLEDDKTNMFEFEPVQKYPKANSYEYRLDLGKESEWTTTEAFTINVGNITGYIQVRVKAVEGKNTFGETLSSNLFLKVPDAPTEKKADDILDILEIAPTQNYELPEFYEFSQDKGKTWRNLDNFTLRGDILVGYFLFRVKARTGENALGAILKSSVFTDNPEAPIEVLYSDASNLLKIAPAKGFEKTTDYEYSKDDGKSWSNIEDFTIRVGNFSGRMFIRVKKTDKNGVGKSLTSSPFTSSFLIPKQVFFDDQLNYLEFAPVEGYPNIDDYEYALPETNYWVRASSFVINVGNIEGSVAVRLRYGGGILRSSKFSKPKELLDVDNLSGQEAKEPDSATVGESTSTSNYMTIGTDGKATTGVSDDSNSLIISADGDTASTEDSDDKSTSETTPNESSTISDEEIDSDLPTPDAPTYSVFDDSIDKLTVSPIFGYSSANNYE